MTTATTLDLSAAHMGRNRYLKAIELKRPDKARRLLVTAYLPALNDLVAGTDPEHIQSAHDAIRARIEKGWAYKAPTAAAQDEADELWEALLDEYELLMDALAMCHEGTAMHPANYLLDRIELWTE